MFGSHQPINAGEKKSIRRVDSSEARDGDPGVKSENEDDHQHRSKPSLGRTPNHLSLSTTSTLSTGSACSQAKLIQVLILLERLLRLFV